jgi:hypothetical protein
VGEGEGDEREAGRADGSRDGRQGRETGWERRRRLAEVFGDVLPATTGDERGPGARRGGDGGRDRGEDPGERWLKDQVPPHHG